MRVSHLRCSLLLLIVFPALTGRANLCRASGAGFVGLRDALSTMFWLGRGVAAIEERSLVGAQRTRASVGMTTKTSAKSNDNGKCNCNGNGNDSNK